MRQYLRLTRRGGQERLSEAGCRRAARAQRPRTVSPFQAAQCAEQLPFSVHLRTANRAVFSAGDYKCSTEKGPAASTKAPAKKRRCNPPGTAKAAGRPAALLGAEKAAHPLRAAPHLHMGSSLRTRLRGRGCPFHHFLYFFTISSTASATYCAFSLPRVEYIGREISLSENAYAFGKSLGL